MIDLHDNTQPMRFPAVSPSRPEPSRAPTDVLRRIQATAPCVNCGGTAKVTSGLRLGSHQWAGEECPGSGRRAGVFSGSAASALQAYESADDRFEAPAAWRSRLHCTGCRLIHELPYATFEPIVLPRHTRPTKDGKESCPGSGERADRQVPVPRSTIRTERAVGGVVLAGILAVGYFLLSSCFGGDEPEQDYADAAVSDAVSDIPSPATPSMDTEHVAYLAILDQRGIPYSSEWAMINLGVSICSDLTTGQYGSFDLGLTVMSTGQFDAAQAGYIVGAAINSYCPQYA